MWNHILYWNCPIHLYFTCTGGYDKEEKAARAYDLAALKYWGTSTTTNFPVRKFVAKNYAIYIIFHVWYL